MNGIRRPAGFFGSGAFSVVLVTARGSALPCRAAFTAQIGEQPCMPEPFLAYRVKHVIIGIRPPDSPYIQSGNMDRKESRTDKWITE